MISAVVLAQRASDKYDLDWDDDSIASKMAKFIGADHDRHIEFAAWIEAEAATEDAEYNDEEEDDDSLL
jgi:hypothetical protein